MTQRDRDKLVVLKKAQEGLITQKQGASELDLSERHVRRLLKKLNSDGDKAVIHGLRGRPSNRKVSAAVRQQAIAVRSDPKWHDFGPTLTSEWLWKHHQIRVGREAMRQIMIEAGLWRAKPRKIKNVHCWRPRRSCRGELVQWDTSEHDWLEGRGEKIYLISMIDDATSQVKAQFVREDSTEQNMRLLWKWLEENGRPLAFYTDKAALFQTAPKQRRDQQALPREEAVAQPPTQIGRALQELQIAWIPAHSPQAKGRIERSFETDQDRLVKGLRLAEAVTLEDANRYLVQEFVPWWNQRLTVVPASTADAHRPLGPEHELASALSHVEHRRIGCDYTIRYNASIYQIDRKCVQPGMRGGRVRVEKRLDGSMAVRFGELWVEVSQCEPRPKTNTAVKKQSSTAAAVEKSKANEVKRTAAWRASGQRLFESGRTVYAAAAADRTRTRDTLD